jgi:hypothetical protein
VQEEEMAINVETKIKTVAVDANLQANIESVCDIEALAGRRLAGAFLVSSAEGGSVVLIFQLAPA